MPFSNEEEGDKKPRTRVIQVTPTSNTEHCLLRGGLSCANVHSLCQHSAPDPRLLCQAWYARVISKMVPSPNVLQSNWLLLHLKYSC